MTALPYYLGFTLRRLFGNLQITPRLPAMRGCRWELLLCGSSHSWVTACKLRSLSSQSGRLREVTGRSLEISNDGLSAWVWEPLIKKTMGPRYL